MAKVKIIKKERDPPLFTSKQLDGQTDGHGETSIPPYNFIAGDIKIFLFR
jgi:hypothetical protein